MSVSDDIGMAELLAIIAAVGVGGYLLYKYFSSATDLSKVGAIPGITGASQSQVCAPNTAASNLKPGGAIVWQCGSDFDYLQPCGVTVTEARHNPINYVWPWSEPVKYSDVPAACYDFSSCSAQRGLHAVTGS